jgi:hypothetical protein
VSVEIETGVVEGRFPRRALAAVMEWYAEHKAELREDWALAAAVRVASGTTHE